MSPVAAAPADCAHDRHSRLSPHVLVIVASKPYSKSSAKKERPRDRARVFARTRIERRSVRPLDWIPDPHFDSMNRTGCRSKPFFRQRKTASPQIDEQPDSASTFERGCGPFTPLTYCSRSWRNGASNICSLEVGEPTDRFTSHKEKRGQHHSQVGGTCKYGSPESGLARSRKGGRTTKISRQKNSLRVRRLSKIKLKLRSRAPQLRRLLESPKGSLLRSGRSFGTSGSGARGVDPAEGREVISKHSPERPSSGSPFSGDHDELRPAVRR